MMERTPQRSPSGARGGGQEPESFPLQNDQKLLRKLPHPGGRPRIDYLHKKDDPPAQIVGKGILAFRENLPPGCPPPEAHANGCAAAYRFVPTNAPAAADFASNAAKLDEMPTAPGMTLCRWSSCSLFPDMETVKKKRKLKNLRQYPFVARLEIKAGSGFLVEGNGHIDFWMHDDFDPVAAIIEIQEL